MSSILGRLRRKDNAQQVSRAGITPRGGAAGTGWRFSLKGSPRHYDDVKNILEQNGGDVYFGEALTYERGAGVALWRVQCETFGWLPRLYDWWAEIERVEPISVGFNLYLPNDLKYPVLDLREHTPDEVEAFIKTNAPKGPIGS